MYERHRIRSWLVSALALTTMLAASMAWFPASVLAVSCPDNGSLTQPSVSPGSGTTTTAFTFSVTYQDNAGEAPSSIRVYLTPGNVARRLNLQSGSLTTGAVYSRTFSVAAGTWNVTFRVTPSTQTGTPQTCEVSGGSITVSPPPTPTPVPTPTPTPRPTPTPTPRPTATPTPRPTPKPTAKPAVTPRPTAKPTAKATARSTPKPVKGTTGTSTPPPKPPASQALAPADPSPKASATATAVPGLTAGGSTGGGGGPTGGTDGGLLGPLLLGALAAGGGIFLLVAKRRRSRRDPDGQAAVPDAAAASATEPDLPVAPVVLAEMTAIDDELAPVDEDAPLKRSRRTTRKLPPAAAMGAAATMKRKFDAPPKGGIERAKVGYRQVRISSEPDAVRSTELGRLDRGDEVEILESHEGFLQIRTPDDITGWILRHTIIGAPST